MTTTALEIESIQPLTTTNTDNTTTTATNTPPTTSTKLTFWSIVIIAANTMNGPGLTTLPTTAQSAGLLTYLLLVVLATLTTSFVVRHLCTLIWTNKHLTHSVLHSASGPTLAESDIVALSSHAFTGSGEMVVRRMASVAMVGCALCLALAQMMICAKIGDAMIVASVGRNCGWDPVGGSGSWGGGGEMVCTERMSMTPFDSGDDDGQSSSSCLMTGGLITAMIVTVGLASVDLDSMIMAQYILFGCLLMACFRFVLTLGWATMQTAMEDNNDDSTMMMTRAAHMGWGSTMWKAINHDTTRKTMVLPSYFYLGPRPFDAVGPILFNFAFIVTAPPLSCGAESPTVAIQSLVTSCIIMGVLYAIIGCVGAPVAASVTNDNDNNSSDDDDVNLLSLVLRNTPSRWDILSVIGFGFSQLAAIPVYCELARETLMTHVLSRSSRRLAFLTCHVLPWIVVAVTYNSRLFESFIEWSSLLLLGFCNFSLPLLLDLMIKEHGVIGGSTTSDQNDERYQSWKIGGRIWQGMDATLWMYALITGSIAAVIAQRMVESYLLAEIVFMGTVLLIIVYHGR